MAVNANEYEKLSYRWQTARRVSANAMAWLTSPRIRPMCYHAEFGRFALKGVRINIEEPPKLGRAETPLS